jgi:hypothetical protein
MSHEAVEDGASTDWIRIMSPRIATLRSQATRLLCQAVDARCKGNEELARLLTDAAARFLEQATAAELAQSFPPQPECPQSVTQQQQQQQPATKITHWGCGPLNRRPAGSLTG